MNSEPLETQASVGPGVRTLELSVELPDGFEAAAGFRQTVTVSALDSDYEIEIASLGEVLAIPIEGVQEVILTLSIGFCTIQEKDVCYVDRSTLAITRTRTAGSGKSAVIRYSPEDPT